MNISITLARKLKEAGLTREPCDICVGDLFCSGEPAEVINFVLGDIVTGYAFKKVEALDETILQYLSYYWYWLPTKEDIDAIFQKANLESKYVKDDFGVIRCNLYSAGSLHVRGYSMSSDIEAAGNALLQLLLKTKNNCCDDKGCNAFEADIFMIPRSFLKSALSDDEQQEFIVLINKIHSYALDRCLCCFNKKQGI